MTPEALMLSRRIIREKSKSFYLASRILPRRERQWTMVLYAWCRRADDAVDEGLGDKRAALTQLRAELDDMEGGCRASDPIVDAFSDVMRQCLIPMLYPRELLRGMEADVDPVLYQTMDELYEYCYRAAGTVGLMMTHIMGVDDSAAMSNAAHLGVAMQLTNICRDVAEDWRRGRLYLPADLLARHGVTELVPEVGHTLPKSALAGLARTVEELLQIADRYYLSADAGLDHLPWRSSVAIAAARKIYAEIGEVLKERAFDVSAGRAFVPAGQKFHLVRRSLVERLSSQAVRCRLSQRSPRFVTPESSLAFTDMPRL